MAEFLLVYGTGEGQTAKVADRIAEALREHGHAARTVEAGPDVAVGDADAVLVGASIHVGKHQAAVGEFVRANREALARRPTAFFQVSLSAALPDEESQAQAAGYVDEFVEATGWQPDRVASFGGALRYSEYGFLKRAMIKRIAKGTTGDTDTARDYEYTDWDEVERFAADVAAFVERSGGPASGEGEQSADAFAADPAPATDEETPDG